MNQCINGFQQNGDVSYGEPFIIAVSVISIGSSLISE